jgi:transposase-like protein
MPYDRTSVKLPGSGRHTLLKLIGQRKITYADVARALDVTPQALASWIDSCEKNRNFLMPAEHIPKLSRLLRVRPAKLRPDLYRPGWSFQSPGSRAGEGQKSPR